MNKALCLLLFLSPPCWAAQPWVPVDCAERFPEIEALAGSPYPQRTEDVLQDLRYAVEEVLVGDTPLHDLSAGTRRLLEGLREGALRTEIVRIENWSPSRCSSRRPKPFYHLIRVFDGAEELARCALHDTGLLAQCGFRSEEATDDAWWMPAEGLQEHLRQQLDLDLPVTRAQHVTSDGLPFCSVVSPCLAFTSRGRSYLLARGELLYELELEHEISVTARRQQALAQGLAGLGAHDLDHPEVTVGFAWVPARRIAGDVGE